MIIKVTKKIFQISFTKCKRINLIKMNSQVATKNYSSKKNTEMGNNNFFFNFLNLFIIIIVNFMNTNRHIL